MHVGLLALCARRGLLLPTYCESCAQESMAVALHRHSEPANDSTVFQPGLWSNLGLWLPAITLISVVGPDPHWATCCPPPCLP